MDTPPDNTIPVEPPPPTPAPPPLVVIDSRPCLACGYDLKGLSAEGVCPECGAAVARSLKGNLLEFADPEYLRTLNHGTVLIIWGAFAPLLAGGLAIAAYGLAQSGYLSAFMSGRGSEVLPAALSAVGASVSLIGWFLFTRPDPGQIGVDGGEKARKWVRVMLVAEVGVTLAALVVAFVPSLSRAATQAAVTGTGAAGGPTVPLIAVIVGVSISVLSAGISAARASLGAWYVYTLASRIPDMGLRKFAKTMIWLYPVLMTVGILACGLGPLSAWIISIVIATNCRKGVRAAREKVAHTEWAATYAVPPQPTTHQ